MKPIYWTYNPGTDYERQYKGLLGEVVIGSDDLYRVYRSMAQSFKRNCFEN